MATNGSLRDHPGTPGGSNAKGRRFGSSPSQRGFLSFIRHISTLSFNDAFDLVIKELVSFNLSGNRFLKFALLVLLLLTLFSINTLSNGNQTIRRHSLSENDYVNSLIRRDSQRLAAVRSLIKSSVNTDVRRSSMVQSSPSYEHWPYGFDWVRSLLGIKAKKIPSLVIYSTPKPYQDSPNDPQKKAILSWLRLSPQPKIVLFGNDNSFYELAEEFENQIFVEPNIDRNFEGIPLFSSILWRAQAMDSDISLLINSETVLLDDFLPVIYRMADIPHWMMIARGWKLTKQFTFNFDTAPFFSNDPKSASKFDSSVKNFVFSNGYLSNCSDILLWAWNRTPLPLHYGIVPPFLLRNGIHDDWLTHQAAVSKTRRVVDASEVMTVIDFTGVENVDQTGNVSDSRVNGDSIQWKANLNDFLARDYASVQLLNKTEAWIPERLFHCKDTYAKNRCIMENEINLEKKCTCTDIPSSKVTAMDPIPSPNPFCNSLLKISQTSHLRTKPNTKTLALPHTLEKLLAQVARREEGLKVVTLVVVSASYVDMLLSFSCRLRVLGLADNLIVAALDETAYHQAFIRGLAVYMEPLSQTYSTGSAQNSTECGYGSVCFQKTTKMKSMAVLRILKMGYSVLLSDVDVVWFKDPLPHLLTYGAGSFPVQSNEPNANKSAASMRRLNPGFYLARAEGLVIIAFEQIVNHANSSNQSELPSFYYVLCGYKKERVVEGKDECMWNGLRVVFLDRAMYPNGAVHGIWTAYSVERACQRWGCTILHNNFASGKSAALERLKKKGLWMFDEERGICKYHWHRFIRAKVIPAQI